MAQKVKVGIEWLDHARGMVAPMRATKGAAGFDLSAVLPEGESVVLEPGRRATIGCGFRMALPQGYEGQVRPRSGLALRRGVTVLNAPGTIDCDYRGEVRVLLINLGDEPFEIRRGERIAQLVVAPVAEAVLIETDGLSETARGEGGFGSTGTRPIRETI